MKDDRQFRVGDKIVDFGQVCRISKIKKSSKGKKEKTIFFRPFFRTKLNKTLIYSVPLDNINKTKIRKPVSKKKLRQFLKELSRKLKIKEPVDVNGAKEALNSNDLHKIGAILKALQLERNDESKKFGKAKKDILDLAMERLIEEIAFVSEVSLVKSRKKIEAVLRKAMRE